MTEEAEEAVNLETSLEEASNPTPPTPMSLEDAFKLAQPILQEHVLGVQQERDALKKILKIVKIAVE
jgi:hypothetical protein